MRIRIEKRFSIPKRSAPLATWNRSPDRLPASSETISISMNPNQQRVGVRPSWGRRNVHKHHRVGEARGLCFVARCCARGRAYSKAARNSIPCSSVVGVSGFDLRIQLHQGLRWHIHGVGRYPSLDSLEQLDRPRSRNGAVAGPIPNARTSRSPISRSAFYLIRSPWINNER